MSGLPMNKFEIIDLPGMKTVAFAIEKEKQENNIVLTLQKIDHVDENSDGKDKKVFYVMPNGEERQGLVILTLAKNRALVNLGVLENGDFEVSEDPLPLNYGTIFNTEGIEYKEFAYTPNMKRIFSIVDAETGDEVKPMLYVDEKTKQIKGKCQLLPNKPYIALELKSNSYDGN